MQVSLLSVDRSGPWSLAQLGLALFAAGLAGACGGSSVGSGQSGITGEEATKPGGGGQFFVDENQSGGAAHVRLPEQRWGRLVDIHEEDAQGKRVAIPVFTDFVIEPDIVSGSNYVLDRDLITQRDRLTIRAQKTGVVDTSAFDQLLLQATDALPVISAKNDNGASSPPFSTVPRNACIVLRFDDCLDDDASALLSLSENVRVFTGYPPVSVFAARVVFDPNHGAIVGDAFHSTRVLVDMTTSVGESNGLGSNVVGLPASLTTSNSANVSIRIPSVVDIGTGQFQVLTNLSGHSLDDSNNGPVDLTRPSHDVVRAVQSGNADNPSASNGFLPDTLRPRILSGWPVSVTQAADDPVGDAGLDFVLDLSFSTTCLGAPIVGDVITVGGAFLQVTADAALAGSDVSGLSARSVSSISNPLTLLGDGLYQTPFRSSLGVANACWVSFLPEATTFPSTGISTTSQIVLRFSEPMDPDTLSPFREFLVVGGAAGVTTTAKASNLVIGDLVTNSDLTQFSFTPHAPFPHTQISSETFHLELGAAKDLAGNTLPGTFPFVDFTIDPLEATRKNGALVLRLDAADEYAPNGGTTDTLKDLRGQFNYNSERGSITPRPVAFSGWPVDNTNPLLMAMVPIPNGVFTPLNPLGAKLQTVWRYADMGWAVRDETKYNLDVIGMNWSPVGGLVVADFYDTFEIQLGHSKFLPDETCCGVAPNPKIGGTSGLPGNPALFSNNYLIGTTPKVVHNKALGYTINPASLFNATTGTPMIPYPLNRGLAPEVTYTWRDTAILGLGGGGDANQKGVPLEAEVSAGVATGPGSFAGVGVVPTVGLPLLIEIRCHPSNQGIGLNRFAINISNTIAPIPGFRAYSAGGINTLGNPVLVLPDAEAFPQGGFNANSNPPGIRTATSADNAFYLGQLDTVVKFSRVHTVWLDTGLPGTPLWQAPVLEPPLALQPLGTAIQLAYRSATGFSGGAGEQFNGDALGPYGNETVAPPIALTDWSDAISSADNKRYLQVRITFTNNISTGVTAELKALGLPFNLP